MARPGRLIAFLLTVTVLLSAGGCTSVDSAGSGATLGEQAPTLAADFLRQLVAAVVL